MRSTGDLSVLEHQMHRDHEYDPVGCLECRLARMATEDLRARFQFNDYSEGPQPKLVREAKEN